jgi:hypothetical protein
MANPALAPGALQKRSKEDAELEKRARKAAVKTHEQTEKDKVRLRDGAHYCRLVPRCQEKLRHETAHVFDKGMGGDHGHRTKAELMLRACFFHHQGNWSLHSKDLRVVFLTERMADGPIEVWGKDEDQREFLVGRESSVGVWERD